jgi:hypothetical protein
MGSEASSRSINSATARTSSADSFELARCSTGVEAEAGAVERIGGIDALAGELGAGAQLALVVQLRGEGAQVGVQAPRLLAEEATVAGERVGADEVLERGHACAGRVHALRGLLELARIAEQDDAPGRAGRGEHVGERDLAGLIDDEQVDGVGHLLAGPEPDGAGGEIDVALGQERLDLRVLVGALDGGILRRAPLARLLDPPEGELLLARGRTHLVEQVHDDLVTRRGDADALPGPHRLDDQR